MHGYAASLSSALVFGCIFLTSTATSGWQPARTGSTTGPRLDAHGILVDWSFGPPTSSLGATLPALRLDTDGAAGAIVQRELPLLSAIAKDYLNWGAVDDMAHWAPADCKLQPGAAMHKSDARGAGAHENKLYRLFASSRNAYIKATSSAASKVDHAPPGLVIVKESFVAEPVAPALPAPGKNRPRDEFAQQGGQSFHRGAFVGLFVMIRKPDAAPATDAGWLYATIASDGRVTAVGRVASCMGCHQSAPHGRLYGVPVDQQ